MKRRMILLIVLLALSSPRLIAADEAKPALRDIDRVRLREAFKMAEAFADELWDGWSKAPFAVLLVTPDHEFLIRHPQPSEDFTRLGYDEMLQSDVFVRQRTFPINLQACFPAVNGVWTIVIGQAETTQSHTSSAWAVTVLHEHFHQLQGAQPTYPEEVAALDLARGDQTGMWMLNFPFPYDTPVIQERVAALNKALIEALRAEDGAAFRAKLAAYKEARQQLQAALKADDYRYLSFQLWQEGIARYTEYRVALRAGDGYKPSAEFQALTDYTPFEQVAEQLRQQILDQLSRFELARDKRVMFYPMGAAEGILLDRANPQWRKRYFAEKFYLERYFE